MKSITLWEGKVKIIAREDREEKALSFDTEEMNLEGLEKLVKSMKPRWRNTLVFAVIGSLEGLKYDLLNILEESEDEQAQAD